jgi:hypothetical protein
MAAQARSKTAVKDKLKDEVEEKVDNALVEETVEFISKTLADTVYKGAVTVGEYVLKHFFNNDVKLAQSRDPYKNVSFRSLADKCGTSQLPISKSWLHNAVSVVVMQRSLPDAKAYKQLPPSHQVTLLPLKEPARVEKLAEKALSKELSVKDLKAEVVKERAKIVQEGEPRGRPPLPRIVKTLNRSLRLFTLESGRRSFTKAMVEELDDKETKKALVAAEGLIESLKDLVGKLKAKAKA